MPLSVSFGYVVQLRTHRQQINKLPFYKCRPGDSEHEILNSVTLTQSSMDTVADQMEAVGSKLSFRLCGAICFSRWADQSLITLEAKSLLRKNTSSVLTFENYVNKMKLRCSKETLRNHS